MSTIVRSHFSSDLKGSMENMELANQKTNIIANVIVSGEENDFLTKLNIFSCFG